MPKQPDNELLSLLFEALNSPYGRKIVTNNPNLLRQRLYSVRKSDPIFEPLSFVIGAGIPEGELWIIKRTMESTNAES